ncbi:MAG: outer membrane protein assembly factor BamE [Pseudomonadota bacterium]
MAPTRSALRLVLLASCALVLAACSATFRNHGYMPPEEDLAGIIVGVDTRDSVEGTVGKPGVSGIVDAGGWYYVRSRIRNFAWQAPEEIDREVLAISFSPTGTVTNIERFGLEDGRVVRLSRRVTDSNTQGIGFLRQAFGNLGRFDAGTLLN